MGEREGVDHIPTPTPISPSVTGSISYGKLYLE